MSLLGTYTWSCRTKILDTLLAILQPILQPLFALSGAGENMESADYNDNDMFARNLLRMLAVNCTIISHALDELLQLAGER